jgi:hypothetical protein
MKHFFGNRTILSTLFLLLFQQIGYAATYTVTNTNNSGAGSFRQAIIDANANAGADIIRFLIPDLGLAGQYFEGNLLAGTRVAVIRLTSALPVITGAVTIDGTTQANTNTGVLAGRVVGADNVTQPNINYPDIYIVADIAGGYLRSTNTTTSGRGYGNGININTANVTIRGIAISGFGNTSSSAATAGLSGDIALLRSSTPRTANLTITDCFIGATPYGTAPTQASNRRSISAGIVLGGNNNVGTISRNFIHNVGTYGIHFNSTIDHADSDPSNENYINRLWTIEDNQLIDISWNNSYVGPGNTVTSATGLVADAINTMHGTRFSIRRNYIENVEQVGIDLGWNADSNYVENNSITGFTKTYAGPVQCGIRAALSSRLDTIVKNRIYDNPGTAFKSGIWIDMSAPPASTTGLTYHDNEYHYIAENIIYNNTHSSGITLSDFTPTTLVNNRNNFFSRNLLYNNGGLGIDLQFAGNTGSPLVTVNDDADADAGTNNIINFPVIDSVKKTPTSLIIYGKVAAGAYMEFFFTDGGTNQHGGRLFNYGEAEYFIGSGTEGSVADLRTTTGLSYNIDGNIATGNVNGFTFSFPMVNLPPDIAPFVTATATIANNTSELGPMLNTAMLLDDEILTFSGKKRNNAAELMWEVSTNPTISFFEVQHSTNGTQFSPAGITQYNTTTEQEIQNYSKLMANTVPGNNYYRLRTVYNDGTSVYSKIVMFNFRGITTAVKVGPNPFTNKINIHFQETNNRSEYQVRLLDVSGKIINKTTYTSIAGFNRFTWDINGLKDNHVYIIEMISETGEKFQQKLMHQ